MTKSLRVGTGRLNTGPVAREACLSLRWNAGHAQGLTAVYAAVIYAPRPGLEDNRHMDASAIKYASQ